MTNTWITPTQTNTVPGDVEAVLRNTAEKSDGPTIDPPIVLSTAHAPNIAAESLG